MRCGLEKAVARVLNGEQGADSIQPLRERFYDI
jgi:hypothetical protein